MKASLVEAGTAPGNGGRPHRRAAERTPGFVKKAEYGRLQWILLCPGLWLKLMAEPFHLSEILAIIRMRYAECLSSYWN